VVKSSGFFLSFRFKFVFNLARFEPMILSRDRGPIVDRNWKIKIS